MRVVVVSAFLVFLFPFIYVLPVAADEVEDAVQAYSRADYRTAINMARLLAEAGNADAQYLLAMAYMDGHGVGKDLVESYKWYELVVRGGDAGAELDRDDVASQLSPDQLAEAKKRADEWAPK